MQAVDQDGVRHVLEIKYDITRPVDLVDLTQSLLALADEYQRHVAEAVDSPYGEALRLHVREIRTGSIITELVPYAAGLLPLMSDVNTVVGFSRFIGNAIKGFISGKSDPQLDRRSLENLNKFLEPVAKDHASQINIAQLSGDFYLVVNSQEANAAQNEISRQLRDMKQSTVGAHDFVVLRWYQARHDLASSAGDRGIIESISPKSVKVLFASEHLKAKMLYVAENPFESAWLVNVVVETVNGKPAVYKVTDVHERIDVMGE